MCLGVGLFRVAVFGTPMLPGSGCLSVSLSEVRAAISHWAVLCCAKLLQSCPTLCDPVDHSPPGSSVHGIFQARIQAWVACPCPGKDHWEAFGPSFLQVLFMPLYLTPLLGLPLFRLDKHKLADYFFYLN